MKTRRVQIALAVASVDREERLLDLSDGVRDILR